MKNHTLFYFIDNVMHGVPMERMAKVLNNNIYALHFAPYESNAYMCMQDGITKAEGDDPHCSNKKARHYCNDTIDYTPLTSRKNKSHIPC